MPMTKEQKQKLLTNIKQQMEETKKLANFAEECNDFYEADKLWREYSELGNQYYRVLYGS